jgi:glycosyltransferase involved in cell wall biosynthesis
MRGMSDDELWQLIRDASFTVFISLHEGFGLPVAESLACGTPVLTTAYGSQGEIAAGGGALTVDPRDDTAVVDSLRRMLTDQELLSRLRAEAAERPTDTWSEYADGVSLALVDRKAP